MSELRKMTRMGGDLRKIARLLQDKGRNGDTILAHINPREAALLREQGGSGDINPETGLMEFSDYSEGSSGYDPAPTTPDYSNVPEGLFEGAAYTPEPSDQLFATRSLAGAPQAETSYFDQAYRAGALPQLDRGPIPDTSRLATVRPLEETQAQIAAEPFRTGAGAPGEKSFLESLQGGDKARLGLGALGGLQTALTARKARQGAQQAAQQIRDIGAPYQQRGLAEQAAAARGELTTVNQQALEAQRARAAQAGVARGGVGIAQQQRAEENLRNRLLAAQQDFGLKLSGIGDQYTAKAIQEGIRADAEISAMYGQYFGNLTRLAAPTIIQSTQPAGK
jgi:hypothetical protein